MSDTVMEAEGVLEVGVFSAWMKSELKKLDRCETVKSFKETARKALLDCTSKEQAGVLLEGIFEKARAFQKENPNLFQCRETRQLFPLLFLQISSDFNYGGHRNRPWDQSVRHYLGKSGVKNLRHEMARQ